jgi:decaprenyl-phosphate phosphoribosyltransferase
LTAVVAPSARAGASAPPAVPPGAAAAPPLRRRSTAAATLALVRPSQWTKNVFVLAPLLFAKRLGEVAAIVDILAAAIVFSLVASAVYVGNDWRDRHEDARHPRKGTRPLACGELDGRHALLTGACCLLLAGAVGIGAALPLDFWLVIAVYVAVNAAYSLGLRHVELVDVLVIASGFVLRVLAGTLALEVPPSQFIVLSTGLLALLLAMSKRRTDLQLETAADRRSLTGYSVEFIDVALSALAASVIGFYALFTVSDYALERYHAPSLYLTTFFVATGVLRYLQVVLAHDSHGSPTEIALSDRFMQIVVAGWVVSFALLAYAL